MTRTPAALAPDAASPTRARSSTVTRACGSARRRWKAALRPTRPPPMTTTDRAPDVTEVGRDGSTRLRVEAGAEVRRQHGADVGGASEEPHAQARHAVVAEVAQRRRHRAQGERERSPEAAHALGDVEHRGRADEPGAVG